MKCIYCDQDIKPQEPAVKTTDRRHVHIACADRVALAANRGRSWDSAIHAGILVDALIVAAVMGHPIVAAAILVVGVVAHAWYHRLLHHRTLIWARNTARSFLRRAWL
jgi:hypothetical protein